MIDAIKKVMLAGVGAAAISTEKAEKALNELVEKGKLSATDAKEAAKKIADEGKQEFEEASKSLEDRFDSMLKKLGRGQAERIESLETKLAAVEARLAALEKESPAKVAD
ncbi:hypothetical protein IEN85_05520 [Pelagicoccus sp. NFK12]|uniref:Polyhydroxyalkanoate synthesis regulator phasin n=1 Tax=Pelagicoccus enzymogenes TaxID=2773457 RepID=A0A927F5T7_9BACT|nr:hypothetical protein [Pelagicoccus enzymogenes]MBD5778943.1 hypothetical protein [Pelagicoccus enzymogenes]MDQ8197313.1 hypothetical protein [Pelagicoccus enzymogenes]